MDHLPNPSTCPPGQEQYKEYYSGYWRGYRTQYDYRTPDGKLFSTIAPDLQTARARRDKWLEPAGDEPLAP